SSVLLGFFFAGARGGREALAVDQQLDLEELPVVGASGPHQTVLGQRPVARLQELLERRLVVLAGDARPARLLEQRTGLAHDERARVLDAAVQIDRGNQRLVPVGEQRLLAAAAGFLLAAPEQQMIAEAQPLGLPRQRRRRDDRRFRLRLLPFVVAGELAEE